MTRTKLVSIRLSDAECARLMKAAEAALTNLSAFMRDLAIASLDASRPAPIHLSKMPEGPLTEKVSSRLTAGEAEELSERARECDLTVAAYVRHLLRGSSPSARRPEARAAVVALSRVGNNLNQLTRLTNGGTLMPRDLYAAIETLRAEVYRLREDLLSTREGRP